MAFLRRGYVPRYYEGPPSILLTNLSSSAVVIDVAGIMCFEEHTLPMCFRAFVTVFTHGGNHTVNESFDQILAKLGEKAVAP